MHNIYNIVIQHFVQHPVLNSHHPFHVSPHSGNHLLVLYSQECFFVCLSHFFFCSLTLSCFLNATLSEITLYASFSDSYQCMSVYCQYIHSALYSLALSILLQMAWFHSFLWLNYTPLYTYITSFLSIQLLMGTRAASIIWIL